MSELIECLDGLTANQIIRRIAKTANGQPFYLSTVGAGGAAFCAEYQAVYDSFTTKPSDAVAAAQNTMVQALVDGGVWAKLDVFYIYAGHTNGAGESQINWMNPGTFDGTLHGSTDPAFVAYEGFTGNPPQLSRIDWNWNPNTDGVNYQLNDASAGYYCRTNTAAGAKAEMGIGSATNTNAIHPLGRYTGDNSYIRLNNATPGNAGGSTDARGFWLVQRVIANWQDMYRNKVRIINHNTAAVGIFSGTLQSLCRRSNVSYADFTDRQLSMVFGGGGLTVPQITTFTDAFEAYMDSNGKGIIP